MSDVARLALNWIESRNGDIETLVDANEAILDLSDAWPVILELVRIASSDDVLSQIAAGPFESWLWKHGRAVYDRVELQAFEDARFRKMLRCSRPPRRRQLAGIMEGRSWPVPVLYGKNRHCSDALPNTFSIQEEDPTWAVIDDENAKYGEFPTASAAMTAVLRLLRSRLEAPVVPMWGAGVAAVVLRHLGYLPGKRSWHWRPPRADLIETTVVGEDGLPQRV